MVVLRQSLDVVSGCNSRFLFVGSPLNLGQLVVSFASEGEESHADKNNLRGCHAIVQLGKDCFRTFLKPQFLSRCQP